MAVDPEQIEEIVRETVDLYRAAEQAVLEQVTQRLAEGLDAPDWAVRRLGALSTLRTSVERTLALALRAGAAAIRTALAAAYRAGSASALFGIPARLLPRDPDAARAPAVLAEIPRASVLHNLAAALVQDIGERSQNVLRDVLDAYRRVIAQATAASVAGGITRREASQMAWARFVDRGLTSFRDVSGRRWRLTSYVEMALRTVTARAAVQGQTDRQQRLGLDLVIVSNVAGECERCRPYEGGILRIGPGPTGDVTVPHQITGEPVDIEIRATVEAARRNGFQHPNCRHSLRAYLPGVTKLPPQPTADPEGDLARQRQRAIERNIRRWKEREQAALTPEAKAGAKARVRKWQNEMREHLKANPALKRLSYREQIGAGNLPPTRASSPAPAEAALNVLADKARQAQAEQERLAKETAERERAEAAERERAEQARREQEAREKAEREREAREQEERERQERKEQEEKASLTPEDGRPVTWPKLWHTVSSSEVAASVRRNGLLVGDGSTNGAHYGIGLYLSTDKHAADRYFNGMHDAEDRDEMMFTAQARVQNPFRVDMDPDESNGPSVLLAKMVEVGLAEPGERLSPQEITARMRAAGYDSIYIHQPVMDPVWGDDVGGSQLVVFDAADVKLTDEVGAGENALPPLPGSESAGPEADQATQPVADERAEKEAILAAAPLGLRRSSGPKLKKAQEEALLAYGGAFYTSINGALRGGPTVDELDELIAKIDSAMAASPLSRDVTVWRGIGSGRIFGDRVTGDLTGFAWREDAYASTSASPKLADLFARQRRHEGVTGTLMRITVPGGTGAVEVSGVDAESELLLQHGLQLEVTKDHGVVDGVRRLDVTVVPAPETSIDRDDSTVSGEQAAAQEQTFDERLATATAGKDALAAAPLNLVRKKTAPGAQLTAPQRSALNDYKKMAYATINAVLRGTTDHPSAVASATPKIDAIDSAMADSALTSDVLIYRGLGSVRQFFGRDRAAEDLTGAEWHELAYVSTTTAEQTAVKFGGGSASKGDGLVLRILAPKGTGGVTLSAAGYESEILLERGRSYRVVADHGVVDGVRRLDVEML
ncbi:hypothetical protein GCM10010112_67780 [Actinoplanes lobatus]|uniref:ADP ribosyltransferase domain-containing protein n=1 Tax=Actinoplanes lobatus TaxID=113568 RepID=A0A7W7HEN2_9ACTN|nr:phage minor capsid protein [Actinoplanes lobatus]MBB4749142.1 hypothetical protein [Actinoplanes lobatus]GGN86341.1 hypothetical protein GCM10010112_67780 [Actinoplanes lobatus]GIE42760.1 hypothetical protein Alo02nite_56580 [Actinoplanes lobatus]